MRFPRRCRRGLPELPWQPVDKVADAFAGLDQLATDGVVRREGAVIEVEPEARSLVRAVAASFDAYLPQSTRTHSPAL